MKFENLVGKTFLALVPMFNLKLFSKLKLHGVEAGGIWVESDQYTQITAKALQEAAIKTPIYFVPYHEIRFAMVGGELALSEEAFGV
jgi:hypothetical protein